MSLEEHLVMETREVRDQVHLDKIDKEISVVSVLEQKGGTRLYNDTCGRYV